MHAAGSTGSGDRAPSREAAGTVRAIGHGRINRRNDRHGRFKSIAAARNRPDQARPVVSERPPQLADALHQRIVRDGEIRPDCGKQLVLRDETAGIFDKVSQDREGLRPKGNLVPVEKETAAIQVQDITIESQPLCPHLRRMSRHREWSSPGHAPPPYPSGPPANSISENAHSTERNITQSKWENSTSTSASGHFRPG